jgi:hypothetical protein
MIGRLNHVAIAVPDIGKADFAGPDVAHHIHDVRRGGD